MKIHLLSDLHCEFINYEPQKTDADLIIIAGDLNTGTKGVKWLKKHFTDVPVLYVAGNHEFYHHSTPKLLHDLKKETKGTNIHILENDKFVYGDIAFLGCTLWSDFKLFGEFTHYAELNASEMMTDYRVIRVSPNFRLLKTMDTASKHVKSVDWLKTESLFTPEKKVVITHHAPDIRSIRPETRQDLISAAYASELENLVRTVDPVLWVHGHTHYCCNYMIGNTLVVSNQKGYPDDPVAGFDPQLIIEI